MTLNDLKSEFSQAYVRAVAHAAGYFVQEANRGFDNDGVDVTLLRRGAGGAVRSPRLDLQLKATATPVTEDPFPYDLEVHNYDQLRSEVLQVPRILVVVVVPTDASDWVSANEEQLVVRHCGYWKSLRGAAPTLNSTTVRMRLERKAQLNVSELQSIMTRIQAGGLP